MACPKCNEEITHHDVSVAIAAHDENKLDIIVSCPWCGTKFNDFIDLREMVEL